MQTVNLNARLRAETGKGAARRLRRDGLVPAVFYGPKATPTAIAFGAKEFTDRMVGHEGATLVQFHSEAAQIHGKVVLIKDTQHDALSGRVTHADFYEVDMRETVRVPVALHFVGKPAAVVLGGVLQPIAREIEVECLPGDIPEFIEVDVSALGLQESIHVSEIVLPAGISVPFEDDFAVVTITAPSTEAEPAAEAEETPGATGPAANA